MSNTAPSGFYVQSRSRRGNKWAVMKEGRTRALRLFKDMESAIDYCVSIKTPVLMNYWLINVFSIDARLMRQSSKFIKVVK